MTRLLTAREVSETLGLVKRPTARERFDAKVVPGLNGCLNWTASLVTNGTHGQFNAGSKMVKAHRWIWEQTYGPIPEGLILHHECENPRCVNVDHLKPMTRREHAEVHDMARNLDPGRFTREKTHCPQGHPYTPENTFIEAYGGRRCLACKRERAGTVELVLRPCASCGKEFLPKRNRAAKYCSGRCKSREIWRRKHGWYS